MTDMLLKTTIIRLFADDETIEHPGLKIFKDNFSYDNSKFEKSIEVDNLIKKENYTNYQKLILIFMKTF